MSVKNKKTITLVSIAEEFAQKGLIPEDYKDEFAETLERELRREVIRFSSDVAGVVAQQVRFGNVSYLAA